MQQENDQQEQDNTAAARRERVIEAIYDTVLQPDQFGAFMGLWHDHIEADLEQFDGDTPVEQGLVEQRKSGLATDQGLHAHFQRAYQILEQFGRPVAPSHSAEGVTAATTLSILLRGDGTVVAASAAARAFLGEGVSLTALNDRLNPASVTLLAQELGAVRSGAPQPDTTGPGAILATDRVPRHLIAQQVAVAHAGSEAGGAEHGATGHILIEALDFDWTEEAEAVLVASFQLSRAEVDVVRNLLAGHTLKQIAALTGRSEHTLRNHAKSVLAKTGAPSQTDLIRLVAYLLKRGTASPARLALPGAVGSEGMQMRSGLRMQVFRAGPEDGRPVLFLNGILDGSAPLRFLQDHLARRGLQLIAPLRPGFGGSDPAPEPEQMAQLYLDHVEEVMTRLGLIRPVVMGHMTGGVFALMLGARLRARLAGLVVVAGGMPVRNLRQVQRMAPRQRAIFYTARYAPRMLPMVLRAGIAQLDRGNAEAFMTALYREGTHDLSLIRSHGLGPLIQSGFDEAVEQGNRGFMDEALCVVQDWSAQITGPSAPLVCLQGRHDPVIDPADMQAALGDRPGARVRVLPDAGQLVLYQEPDLVLDTVASLMDHLPLKSE